jgi:SAM-dependent methyltransferase
MAVPGVEMWNKRYSADEYAYGTNPNQFLKTEIDKLESGSVLLGAEGEGRNAIYAAKAGWDVSAFDISLEGKKKAENLAQAHGVSINYRVGELPELGFDKESFDLLVLVFAHFPPSIRSEYHQIMSDLLKPGGIVILEAFSKNHLAYREKNEQVGGPNNLAALISPEDLRADFGEYEIIQLGEEEISLDEGLYHRGLGMVTRFVGRKK